MARTEPQCSEPDCTAPAHYSQAFGRWWCDRHFLAAFEADLAIMREPLPQTGRKGVYW